MTHSQYLLPGLPDLLKSHRLSYKKFLHNGIDEEFDLLSAKTELNEEEIFYEGLKLNHIDELSPSQVESLDYIYHAEEKIFLVPKRTLEDSLRGRQSHSFHLFIPLEVKILPFQDELDSSYLSGSKFLHSPHAHHEDPEPSSRPFFPQRVMETSDGKSQGDFFPSHQAQTQVSTPSSSLPHLFFRGGSGSPLSETRKEFFQAALSFFFQQPKIQKILRTKRFLLLRWFCEKLQSLEPTLLVAPSLESDQNENVTQLPPSRGSFPCEISSQAANEVGSSSSHFDLTFGKFDHQTKTKLYHLYQNILLKFETQTKKKLFKSARQFSQLSVANSRANSVENSGESKFVKHPGSKTRIKRFQKTSRWHELRNEIRRAIAHSDGNKTSDSVGFSGQEFFYPQFPHLSLQASQALLNFKKPKPRGDFFAFDKNSPTNFSEKAQMKLPGFNFKTSGLTAGRMPARRGEVIFQGQSAKAYPIPGSDPRPPSLAAFTSSSAVDMIRLGTVEKTTKKARHTLSHRSLRSPRLFQKVTFIRRIVQAKQRTNQKKKLQEIFVTTFPTPAEKKGLRFWKLQNASRGLHQKDETSSFFELGASAEDSRVLPPSLVPPSLVPPSLGGGATQRFGDQQTEARSSAVKMTGDPSGTIRKPTKVAAHVKFLKHFKTPFHWARPFHFLPVRELRTLLTPVSVEEHFPFIRNVWAKSLGFDSGFKRIPSQFLSLPQNEIGSLWKILPKKSFRPANDAVNDVDQNALAGKQSAKIPGSLRLFFSSRLGFQCYQLKKLAYRQRNMVLLHPENFNKPLQKQSRKTSQLTGVTPQKMSTGRNQSQKATRFPLAQKGKNPSGKTTSGPASLAAVNKNGANTQAAKGAPGGTAGLASSHATKANTRRSKKRSAAKEVGSCVAKKILQKKFNFDRFVLKFKERQALHLKKSFELREKVAWRIEKKSANLRLLPGLEFWEKYHSEKRVEEYWESVLQPYRRNIPSQLFVSIPSGDVIFLKSEKHSRAKELKTPSDQLHEGQRDFAAVEPTSFAPMGEKTKFTPLRNHLSELKASKSAFRSKNQMLWILELMNMKFFMKKIVALSPEMLEFFWRHRFRFLWTALSEPHPSQLRWREDESFDNTGNSRGAKRSGRLAGKAAFGARKDQTQITRHETKKGAKTGSTSRRTSLTGAAHMSSRHESSSTRPGKTFGTPKGLVSPQRSWVGSASHWGQGSGSLEESQGFQPEDSILEERQNLPKVCSDLRKLLSTFIEVMVHKLYDPQKFFVSGQVGKKEWPFQKDGSKSYFALLNLGKMPFMTKQGHFLINGSARVLVSQIAKCPNFYTKMKIDSRGRPRYWTEFVSSFKNAGEWIQFHIDLENKMFFSLGTKRKYSIFIFLGALGISPPEIPDVIEHWDFLKQSIHKEEIPIDQNENFLTYLVEPLEVREARILFHDTQNYSFFPGGEKTDEELQKFFEDIFYNPSRYFLGHAGREALNQRRRFSGVPSRSRALEKEDFLAAINSLIEVRLGLAPPDDIDHLKFRRVRLPGELLQNEFHLALDEIFTLDFTKFREGPLPGDALESHPKEQRRTIFPTLSELEQKIFEKGRPFSVSKTVGIQSTYQVSPLEKRMRNFFHTGQLSQYMDQTNPLAEITHKRRLTSLGPDGLPKQVGVAVRELHPSHFGRICPIETPEGLNAGLVASLSSQAKIGSQHTLLAPYYWVKDQTREFPQKIFQNDILAAAAYERGSTPNQTFGTTVNEGGPMKWSKYPPVLPEVIFLSASAEDSVYICSEDYWFSSKYKNFETIATTNSSGATHLEVNEPTTDQNVRAAATFVGNIACNKTLPGTAVNEVDRSPGTVLLQELRVDSRQGSKEYLQIDSKNSLVKFQTVFPARYQQEFFTVTKSQIDFFGICPTQMISVGTSLIPFLEHDDANRALMGSNMQRQALPLLVLERPLVGTGSEKGVAQSSNSVLLSEFSGQVSFADGRKIVVDSFPKKITSFPERVNTKHSRLLLGSTEGFREQTPPGSNGRGDSQEVFDFGRRNLFQKFQNRTEDGTVKTISRIFTVKMKIQTTPHENSQVVTRRKVFPISDEEYERSRNLLRREFLKKYKEIQRKKVFPVSFWPGERWKKTGALWKPKTSGFGANFASSTEGDLVFDGKADSPVQPTMMSPPGKPKKSRKQSPEPSGIGAPRDLMETGPGNLPGIQMPGVQMGDTGRVFFAGEEVKRIRYQKANFRMPSRERVQTRSQNDTERSQATELGQNTATKISKELLPSGPSGSPIRASEGEPPKVTQRALRKNERPGAPGSADHAESGWFMSSRVKKFFEKPNPHVSNVILKKKSLRRSILPLKTGHLFFEPTPQMIFKNILSKNTKKREILRKAFLQKAFIPYQVDSEGANEVSSSSHQSGSSGRVLKSAGCPRSKVSWSVSMKKVTPYTQMTYTIQGYWRTNQNTLRRQRPAVQAGDWVAAGDLLADSSATLRGELCVGQNILVGYVPWEGYNFEDAIVVNERLVEEDIYTSILIDRYEMEAAIDAGEKITRKIPDLKPHVLKNLDLRGIICVGTWVEEDDILVGKILPVTTELQGYSKLLADIYQIAPPVAKDVSFRVPDRVSGRVLECSVSEMIVRTPNNQSFATPWKVTLYLVEKRRLKLGDKMSGRHGNKGIVSIILPPQDMPFLPDGTPLDVALNPLGVPSRMNVGQLLESLLGLAGKHLHQKYRIPAFDEMYGEDFSRRIVYDKLLEASQKTQKPWLFNPNFPGKMMLRDGRTGDYFHQPILVGYPYMLKLIHMVDDKMHARATGPYTMVTQQPLKGRANRGGQRIGEMEVWAVEAFAASYALQELLTLKSDDISGRNHFLMSFLKRKKRTVGGIPDAFRVLMHELQSLCFHVHYTEDYRLTYPTLLESSQIPETPIPGNYGRGG